MEYFSISLCLPPFLSEVRYSPEGKKYGSQKKYSKFTQANCNQLHSLPGTAVEDASASQCVHTRLTGEGVCLHSGEVHNQINSIPKECAENPTSRNVRSGVHSFTHGCIHSCFRDHSHMKQGSLLILSRSLEIMVVAPSQNSDISSEISLGIGLLTNFMYANKSIVNQIFLRERCSKIQSSCKVFWIIGITDFILKFLFMGSKCLILLMPFFIIITKLVPILVWFHYLISYEEFGDVLDGVLGYCWLTLPHTKTFELLLDILELKTVGYGVAASKRQCSDVDDICSKCQHILCEEYISLWFNRENVSTVLNCDLRPYKQMER
ncbi:unnamed protein product [Nyctereutes procyonoides]|uniref:RING-type E3 ubiquitin transferase n=1 Tax=Nyctereutes procyonoides TaxID=34880 RepID=A0A811ZX97_NYCPR|nr:unnamed protein product [Nyctereutes procyonoides]